MTWTDNPPTEPGWYWVQTRLTSFPEIIEVQAHDGVLGRVVDKHWCSGFLPLGDFPELRGAKWAGPIPLPESEG